MPRGEVVSKVWEYIKSHNLQNPENRREILAYDKLKSDYDHDGRLLGLYDKCVRGR